VLTNIGYLVGYDNLRRDPVWVCYKLCRVTNLKPAPRPKGFAVDTRTMARVSSKDYNGCGYDRGHCAPNRAIGVCYGEQAQFETFLMSNILPEAPRLNRQVWEHLEATEILDYAQRFGTVWIITGPVFGAGNIKLKSGVIIPDACFKIMIREDAGAVKVSAFIIPETVSGNEDSLEFRRSVREIEQSTGLDFMGELPDDLQNQIEAKKTEMW
jgi:endonuclease G